MVSFKGSTVFPKQIDANRGSIKVVSLVLIAYVNVLFYFLDNIGITGFKLFKNILCLFVISFSYLHLPVFLLQPPDWSASF